jgi:hypothetical protein
MVSNPSLTYIGHITDGSPDPNANYKKVKSSGQLDYRKLHKLSQKPRSRIKIELANVNYIKAMQFLQKSIPKLKPSR